MARPLLLAALVGLTAACANSSGHEFGPFQACYREKAAPIWGAYCKAEPDTPQCRR